MKDLNYLLDELAASFRRWDHLYQFGGQDPFHPDGVNLNLVRNHIIYYKRQIKELLDEEYSLFSENLPEIYYRETPQKVDYNYMANADGIRSRAKEQLALYEQDPNYNYILAHYSEISSQGKTKEIWEVGLKLGNTAGLRQYRIAVEQDDLVRMRSLFYHSYEEKAPGWAADAQKLREFLERDESSPTPKKAAERHEKAGIVVDSDSPTKTSPPKAPLDSQIREAQKKVVQEPPKEKQKQNEEQLSFF